MMQSLSINTSPPRTHQAKANELLLKKATPRPEEVHADAMEASPGDGQDQQSCGKERERPGLRDLLLDGRVRYREIRIVAFLVL